MSIAQSLYPRLWFDKDAIPAVDFYCSLFPESEIISRNALYDTPAGVCDLVSFRLWGQRFNGLSADTGIHFSPSTSLLISCDPLYFSDTSDPLKAARTFLKKLWRELGHGGKVLIKLGRYDFSPLYGWIQDRYGLSWQLLITREGAASRPPIMPALINTGKNYGKAAEAAAFYRSVFPGSGTGRLVLYPADRGRNKKGTVMFSDSRIGEQWMAILDGGMEKEHPFTEAVSFVIPCADQTQIDYYWKKLSAFPEAEGQGRLKDRFGLFWQVVPEELFSLMHKGDESQKRALTEAVLGMKKIDVDKLQRVFNTAGRTPDSM
ncbi:MAG: VOC family protein [Spirochaetales bacterium]|nr:VOC family protein [Spirochaetales bacterium]